MVLIRVLYHINISYINYIALAIDPFLLQCEAVCLMPHQVVNGSWAELTTGGSSSESG